MTATVGTSPLPTTSRAPRLALASSVAAAVIIAAGNYHVPPGENGGLEPAISTAVMCAVTAGVIFGLVLPRVHEARRAAVVFGILTILSVAVFWSGITPILAAATWGANDARPAARGVVVLRWVALALAAVTVVFTLLQSHLF